MAPELSKASPLSMQGSWWGLWDDKLFDGVKVKEGVMASVEVIVKVGVSVGEGIGVIGFDGLTAGVKKLEGVNVLEKVGVRVGIKVGVIVIVGNAVKVRVGVGTGVKVEVGLALSWPKAQALPWGVFLVEETALTNGTSRTPAAAYRSLGIHQATFCSKVRLVNSLASS